jgi:hypothetical protein
MLHPLEPGLHLGIAAAEVALGQRPGVVRLDDRDVRSWPACGKRSWRLGVAGSGPPGGRSTLRTIAVPGSTSSQLHGSPITVDRPAS